MKASRFFLIAIIFASSLFAQSASEIIKKVQRNYNSSVSFSAEFKQFKNGEINKAVDGKIYFSGGKVKIIFPSAVIVLIKDTLWNYNKKLNQLVISLNEDGGTPFDFRKLTDDYLSKFNASAIKKGKYFELILKPAGNNYQYEEIKLLVSKKFLIRSVRLKGESFGSVGIDFKNLKFTKRIQEDIFRINIPRNCRIVDLR